MVNAFIQKVLRRTSIGAAAITLAGCTGDEAPEAASQATPDDLHAYVLDCGYSEGSFAWLSGEGRFEGHEGRLANPCFLIRHPDGDMLWEVGLPASLYADGPQETDIATIGVDEPLIPQMARLGVAPDDIDVLAVSHYHIDHAGQPEAAGDATWLVHRADYDVVMGEEPPEHAADLAPLRALNAEVFEGERDVFGDGRVRIVPAPGHTPGHAVLFLDLPETGPVILSGDLWHRAASRAQRTVPAYNASREETLASMDRVEALLEETGARLVIQHEEADYAALPKPPEAMR